MMVLGGWGRVFVRWLGPKDGWLMNGISVLMKETLGSSLDPSANWGHKDKMAVNPEAGP